MNKNIIYIFVNQIHGNMHFQQISNVHTLAFMESIIEDHPFHNIIIMSNWNCNIFDANHPLTPYVQDFMEN